MLKRFIRSTILSVVLVVSVSGCFGDDKDGSSTSIPDSNQTETHSTIPDSNKTDPESAVVLQSLTLSEERESTIRQYGVTHGIGQHVGVGSVVTVMGNYSDGHSEELTDKVRWELDEDVAEIMLEDEYWIGKDGDTSLTAIFNGVRSNTLYTQVRSNPNPMHISIHNNYKQKYGKGRSLVAWVFVDKQPSADITVGLHLNAEDKMTFADGSLEKRLNLQASMWSPYSGWREHVQLIDHDINNSDNFTIMIDPLQSDDRNYSEVKLDDITVVPPKHPRLIRPKISQLRGAIAGNIIKFQVTAKDAGLTYELIKAPIGMKILGESKLNNGDFKDVDGIDIEWKIPKDIEEKVHNITVRATDIDGYSSLITFPIKVAKTTIIPTKVENNELIVTDKNSRLFGMKMRGHNGEDISHMVLKSVDYLDVWNKKLKLEPGDVPEYLPFVIYGMPEKIDVKFPEYIDSFEERTVLGVKFQRYKFISTLLIGNRYYWSYDGIDTYNYENTKGYLIDSLGFDNTVMLFAISKTQKLGN